MKESEYQLIEEGVQLLDDALSRFMECESTELGKALSGICYGALVLVELALKDK